MMTTIREWFLGLSPRERWVLAAGAGLTCVILLWSFVWTPLRNGTAELRSAVAQKQLLLINLQRIEALPADAPQAPRAQGPSLLVLIERTQQAHGLAGAFTRTRPEGADGINVTFQNAAFDDLLAWLIALHNQHGVAVESATFSGTRQQGLVSGQLFLRRA